jgi:hypothetical protein
MVQAAAWAHVKQAIRYNKDFVLKKIAVSAHGYHKKVLGQLNAKQATLINQDIVQEEHA